MNSFFYMGIAERNKFFLLQNMKRQGKCKINLFGSIKSIKTCEKTSIYTGAPLISVQQI